MTVSQTRKKGKVFRQQICIFKFPPRLSSKFQPFFWIMGGRTCQILSLAENPRWSRVWQQVETQLGHLKYLFLELEIVQFNFNYFK